jgi:hypothetical protein
MLVALDTVAENKTAAQPADSSESFRMVCTAG